MGIQELADDHEASSAVRGVSFFRVRDWKGYGVWYKCGTCEPLQSPTSSKRTCKATRLQAEAEEINAGIVQPKDLYSASVIVLPRGRTMCEPPGQ